MTASVQVLAPVSTPIPAPVSAPAPGAPLSIQVTDYRAVVAAGATAVDLRAHHKRQTDGALFGALAVDAAEALDLLDPASPNSLRTATADARWILISDDGHEAEWLAWHLQALGVTNAVFVVGGYQRLRRAGINGRIDDAELAVYSAH